MKRFAKDFSCWTIPGNEHLNIAHISSSGVDLHDLLHKAEVSISNWNGEEGPHWNLEDLPEETYNRIVDIFDEFLKSEAAT